MVMDPTLPRIKVRDLLMQAFLTGWERSDKSTSQDEYLQRADGFWLYYGVEAENFFLIQWYPDEAAANAKLAQLEELGDGKQYLVDLTLKRANPSKAENFGNSNPVQLRS